MNFNIKALDEIKYNMNAYDYSSLSYFIMIG